MTETVLDFNHVSKKFGRFQALDSVSFQIKRGDIYGLIGENGAGKTTIMKLITKISPLRTGSISLFGESTSNYQQALKRTGAMIESPAAFNSLTVIQNLKVIAKQNGIQSKTAIDDTIEFVGLSKKRKTKAKHLSLGQKQRLGLAFAILPHPDFLILDEPINGLDPSGIIEIRKLLYKLNHEQQTTILISSHILTELYQVSTKFGFIHHGKFIKEVTKEELDKEKESGILLDVDDVAKASEVLDSSNVKPFSIQNDHSIFVKDNHLNTGNLSQLLIMNGVALNGMTKQEGSLEQYYTQLMKKTDEGEK
ncbi:ABC transporter ATP-binding protein [Lentilactobacillus kefiri]|uniref:Bacitracin ABC transporter, ATP-binding protein BcrA n=2 Tax=Lentilactobacillus kefiri TaxID=33962 RepID=A0A8E1RK44_LENKE|nr:ABC transporter ATP-binding protein [Lentilactobacillus kefiri]KRL75285.1 bacitracin ABC transporter, ATP-binding protein BcrA [Lentilactobacillus parakefiri DSM 10551]KRM53691.1 bacitracin ABC transporter, ATP-binding protein BcrA [Lentilactobacillus kefiri DSM 20587 = JCM 5818]MCJ2161657.1 ABC transporter ATP-binding protein [Lentilactobacillus kefiri]MCP9369886.1 ABC transporter ATP-binding protein [Lentilactobacillus kefiri]MDH5108405.1 ABC transporter ATP-binding protein [Lentilactobac